MNDLKLGNRMTDITTGFTGLAVNRTEFMNGNVQFSLQQPIKADGVMPDAISIDHHMLDLVDEGIAARVTPSTFESPIVLGNEVECLVTGTRGIATMKTYYLNGCAAYLVTGKIASGMDKSKTCEDWIDQCKLKVVSEGVAPKLIKPAKAENGKVPGGPMTRGIPRSC